MRIVNRKVGGGKTTELLKEMKGGALITYVAPTARQADQAYRQALELGIRVDRSQFVSVSQMERLKAKPGRTFIVDEADVVFGFLFSGPVSTIALTGEVN
jgi:hypothetical protein